MTEIATEPIQNSDLYSQLAVEHLITQENQWREEVQGIAIDDIKTSKPEDAIAAVRLDDGTFAFGVSAIEASLLDRNGESVKHFLREIMTGVEHPRLKPPRSRRHLNYRIDSPVPSLTLVGVFDPSKPKEESLYDLDLIRTKIQPETYTFSDNAKYENVRYLEASQFIANLSANMADRGYDDRPDIVSDRHSVSVFMNLYNSGFAQLAESGKVPQLFRSFPEPFVVGNQETEVVRYTSSPTVRHADNMFAGVISGASSPLRSDYQWINMVLMTHYLDTGDNLLTHEETEVLASWLSDRHAESVHRRIINKSA